MHYSNRVQLGLNILVGCESFAAIKHTFYPKMLKVAIFFIIVQPIAWDIVSSMKYEALWLVNPRSVAFIGLYELSSHKISVVITGAL